MSRYIPYEKMSKLREAAKNGDEMAKKILIAQLGGEDFSADLDTYFAVPVEEPEITEKKVEIIDNEPEKVKIPLEDKKEEVEEEPKKEEEDISKKLSDLIMTCDREILLLASDMDMKGATKKGTLMILNEIKQSCLDNLEKYSKIKNTEKAEEKIEEKVFEN